MTLVVRDVPERPNVATRVDTTAILIGEVRALTIENESLRQRLCAAEAAVSRAEVVRHRGGW